MKTIWKDGNKQIWYKHGSRFNKTQFTKAEPMSLMHVTIRNNFLNFTLDLF